MAALGLAGQAHERTGHKGAEDDAACQASRAGVQSEPAGQPHEPGGRVRSRETPAARDFSRHVCQQAHAAREPAKFRNVPGVVPIGGQLQRGHGARYQNQAGQDSRIFPITSAMKARESTAMKLKRTLNSSQKTPSETATKSSVNT